MRAREIGGLVVWTLAFLVSGCTSTIDRADRDFEEGRLGDAAEGYEAFLLTSEENPRSRQVRFRLAMAYLLPTSPVHDKAKALALLKELGSRAGESPSGLQAALILDLQNQAQTARDVVREQSLELEQVAAWLEDSRLDVELCRRRLADADVLETSRLAELEALRREVERLTREVAVRRQAVDELQQELEQLKKIDIETP